MKQMLSYRNVLLAQTGMCSGILPMALRSTSHQSQASSMSTYVPQPEAMDYRVELLLSRRGTLTRKLIRNPAMPSDELSNRHSVNTG